MFESTSRRDKQNPPEELDIVQVVSALWLHRKWIIACTLVSAFLGIVLALVLPQMYESEAILAPKQTQGLESARFISPLGGGGITSQDKMEVILKSRGLAEDVIQRNNLLPIMYQDKWDAKHGQWITSIDTPTVLAASIHLSLNILDVTTDRGRGTIRVKMAAKDPDLAKNLVELYLKELTERFRDDVMQEAESNREYLEAQLSKSSDPVMRNKIQTIIASQIEKSMLVSSAPFETLEYPVAPMYPTSPNKKLVVVISILIGVLFSVLLLAARKAAAVLSDMKLDVGSATGGNAGLAKSVSLRQDIRAFRDAFAHLIRSTIKS